MNLLFALPFVAHAASPGGAASLPVALEEARRALVRGDEFAARQAVSDAEVAAGASSLLVPPRELARIRYYEGVAAWRGGLQQEAMLAWRGLWQIGGWDPDDDGLLDDDGMAVLRALRGEGGHQTVPVRVAGEPGGALVLRDGWRLRDGGDVAVGLHLVQVRCPDGAVSSRWMEVDRGASVVVACRRNQVPGGAAGANDVVLYADADEELVNLALFGAYQADATIRLAIFGAEGGEEDEAEPAPPPEDVAGPSAPAPSPAPRPTPPTAAGNEPGSDTAPPSDGRDDPAAGSGEAAAEYPCEGDTRYVGGTDGPGWTGSLAVEPSGGEVRQGGVRWRTDLGSGDLSLRLPGEGNWGLRVFAEPGAESGVAVRVSPGRVAMRALPDGPVMGRDLPTDGPHELQVDTAGAALKVRLDGRLLIGMTTEVDGPAVAVEADTGSRLGTFVVCAR
jgi:hypothetical protein